LQDRRGQDGDPDPDGLDPLRGQQRTETGDLLAELVGDAVTGGVADVVADLLPEGFAFGDERPGGRVVQATLRIPDERFAVFLAGGLAGLVAEFGEIFTGGRFRFLRSLTRTGDHLRCEFGGIGTDLDRGVTERSGHDPYRKGC